MSCLDEAFVKQASEWLDLADDLLLGRRTYEAFALPKYLVSNTLDQGSWNPTTVLRGDVTDTVGVLKAAGSSPAEATPGSTSVSIASHCQTSLSSSTR